ncbi:TonB-dependent receptor [Novosphingobium sp. 9U]|uniref:TonB-dependent receptor n=1 Tax=Novosphingobium sp. 9U TaxID=2653158 RepID=UPI001357FE06|nr:TonB-dependent receptor [Novosphingobium sp. 9U]
MIQRTGLSARAALLLGAIVPAVAAAPALAQDSTTADATAGPLDSADDVNGQIIVTGSRSRSATAITGVEIQNILPGVSPLKAIQTLPGVTYITADPWGNNEQNASLYIHGFNSAQLGYTMDGVPLGDQNYGNYNGLSVSRAVISENVGRVTVSTGAGELRVASVSNLGGAIETLSSDPRNSLGLEVNQTIGSYDTSRTFVRFDSGEMGGGNSFYLSAVRQKARAWDFNGKQGGWQGNFKFVHDDSARRLTAYIAYSDKTEPNEDATTIYKTPANASQAYQPYTRPFFYPDFAGALAYLNAAGQVPTLESVNYRNYYSDAQRTDWLLYLKDEERLSDKVTWSVQGYYHHNDGAGVVAGPISVAGLPALFALYFPGQNLRGATGNSGYAVRTTEYRIDRKGVLSEFNVDLGAHQIAAGVWYENNSSAAYRRWYPLDVNHPERYSPYIRPKGPLFTQYGSEMRTEVLQLHLQDTWALTDRVTIEAGVKTSLQDANGYFTVQPIPGSLAGASGALPEGRIKTDNWFLPTIGAKWAFTETEELYGNVQKNLRQYQAYGAGGSAAPWSVGSQGAFDYIKENGRPETSWTYEIGLRSRHSWPGSFLSGFEAQVNAYHVDFSDRLLAISPTIGGIGGGSIAGGTPSLFNVGDVKTNGVDAALTLRFGDHLSLYNAISYNSSKYQSDYSTATGEATGTRIGGFATVGGVVPTGGKQVPGSPQWLNKTVATLNVDPFELQFFGDYVGKRFATYTNDAAVKSFFLLSGRAAIKLPASIVGLANAELSVNVTNILDKQGWLSVGVNANTNTYNVYPIPPRQWFGTLKLRY